MSLSKKKKGNGKDEIPDEEQKQPNKLYNNNQTINRQPTSNNLSFFGNPMEIIKQLENKESTTIENDSNLNSDESSNNNCEIQQPVKLQIDSFKSFNNLLKDSKIKPQNLDYILYGIVSKLSNVYSTIEQTKTIQSQVKLKYYTLTKHIFFHFVNFIFNKESDACLIQSFCEINQYYMRQDILQSILNILLTWDLTTEQTRVGNYLEYKDEYMEYQNNIGPQIRKKRWEDLLLVGLHYIISLYSSFLTYKFNI